MSAPVAKRLAMVIGLLFLAPLSGAGETAAGRLPRTNLMVYRAPSGKVLPVRSRSEWERRRTDIVRGMEQVMGPLPGKERRCALDVRVEEETDKEAYVQRLITYASEPGSRVPAFLLIPKGAMQGRVKAPAVLALHSTDAQYGHRVLVEELRSHYRAFGTELARRGYIVLAPAYPHLANYAPDLKALGYQSGTMKAVWDNIRGLDLLQSLPSVKRGSIGASGHSLGGHNAIYTAVFDRRIKVVVSSCGFDSFLDYMGGNIEGWTSERYMPRLARYRSRLEEIPFDFHELLGALAPRPLFVNAPQRDTNFKAASVDEVVTAARRVYELYGAGDRLVVEHPDAGHDFPEAVRERAYEFLDRCLKPAGPDPAHRSNP